MPGNDTAALVVALSAQLTKFEKDMKDAVSIADRQTKAIETRFATLNRDVTAQMSRMAASVGGVLTGIGTSFLGAAGISGLGLAGLFATAVRLNGELARIPGLAREAGLSTDRLQEIRFAANIRGVSDEEFTSSLRTSLSLLDEAQRQVNGLSRLFNANGLSIRNSNGELMQFDQLLETAARLMVNARTEQEKIRIVEMLGLSREWIRVLRDGPDEFRRAAAEARNAGAVIDAETVQRARDFDHAWTAAVVRFKAGFTEALASLATAFGQFWTELANSLPGASWISRALDKLAGGLRGMTLPELRDAMRRSIEEGVGDIEIARIQAEIDRRLGREPLRVTVTPQVSEAPTVIPREHQKTPFESAVFNTTKRIAELNAETASIGLNSEARERARLVAELEEAAKESNTRAGFQNATVTDLQRQKINELADAMEAAVRRQRESHAELMRFAVEGRDAVKQFDQFAISSFGNLESAMAGVITGTKSAKDAFRDMTTSILADLAKMIIRLQITAPLARALGSALQGAGIGVGGSTGSLFGSEGVDIPIPQFAGGGVMDRDGLAMLHANEVIFTPDQIRALSSSPRRSSAGSQGGGHTEINIINNHSGAEVSQTERQGPNGKEIIDVVVGRVIDKIGSGSADKMMRARFGMSPTGARR